jgi:hypothetical protein
LDHANPNLTTHVLKYFLKVNLTLSKVSQSRGSVNLSVTCFGVPEQLTSDDTSQQTGPKPEFMQNVGKYEIKHHVSELHQAATTESSRVGNLGGQEVKVLANGQEVHAQETMGLWYITKCEVMSLTAYSNFALEGQTPWEQFA